MSKLLRLLLAVGFIATPQVAATAQTFRSADSVIKKMWQIGMEQSQTETLAQVLADSIGPRLSGTAGFANAVEWLEKTYKGWGIPVRREQYGTWRGWRMGTIHMQMIAPRFQNLEVEMLAWSPPTPKNGPIEGPVAVIPELADSNAVRQWLGTLKGKFVLVSAPEIMCRAPQELERYARPATVTKINQRRIEVQRQAAMRLRALAMAPANTPNNEITRMVYDRLESAGVIGVGSLNWSGGWGVNKIFGSNTERVPSVDLSCEDYGLLHRMATNNQGPRVRLTVESQATPAEVPMFTVVAELKGTELPNEYVLFSAHLDSWAGATGATDNGTGTITMLEAMRILKEAYPHPRRTIIAGHWGGEEQGTIGSKAFSEDHPEVIQGLQAVFNQDNGSWRVEVLEGQGFAKASVNLAKWVSQLPGELTDSVKLQVPGPQLNGSSDHTSFLCHSAPAFRLQSSYTEYRQYTWHTNRDTYDKIVFDDLKNNATMAAMLAYAASEDPEKTSRELSTLPPGPNGNPRAWPTCGKARRSYKEAPAPRR